MLQPSNAQTFCANWFSVQSAYSEGKAPVFRHGPIACDFLSFRTTRRTPGLRIKNLKTASDDLFGWASHVTCAPVEFLHQTVVAGALLIVIFKFERLHFISSEAQLEPIIEIVHIRNRRGTMKSDAGAGEIFIVIDVEHKFAGVWSKKQK